MKKTLTKAGCGAFIATIIIYGLFWAWVSSSNMKGFRCDQFAAIFLVVFFIFYIYLQFMQQENLTEKLPITMNYPALSCSENKTSWECAKNPQCNWDWTLQPDGQQGKCYSPRPELYQRPVIPIDKLNQSDEKHQQIIDVVAQKKEGFAGYKPGGVFNQFEDKNTQIDCDDLKTITECGRASRCNWIGGPNNICDIQRSNDWVLF